MPGAIVECSQGNRLVVGRWRTDVIEQARVDVGWGLDAPGAARLAVAEALGGYLDSIELDDTRLMVSELVAYAITHGRANAEHHVILHVALSSQCVRAEVCDHGPGLDPNDRPPREGPGGLGLMMVDRLATRWGVAVEEGTCVWFEIDRRE